MKIAALSLAILLAWCGIASAGSIVVATTTSTQDSGLLDYLTPLVTKDTGVELKFVSVGTGKALELGKNCDADVVLVHAPKAEKEFVDAGFGLDRREVMYNDFVLVGPVADPAGTKGRTVPQALAAVEARKAPFISRGDESGTHKMEKDLWKAAGLAAPDGQPWYSQAGQGMMAVLVMAGEKGGYTLTDRATWYKYEAGFKGKPSLAILVEGDKSLLNQYGVIQVNPARCPSVRKDLGVAFADWLTSAKGQAAIAGFTMDGKQLFFPNAKK